jgi:hypothetical protein
MKYYKSTEDDYIALIGTDIGGEEISQEEYENILATIHNRPIAEPGYTYKLRTDLTWELCEVPVVEDDAEATEEDFLTALEELGVSVNEEV